MGVVPHYVDKGSKEIQLIRSLSSIKLIDVFSPVEEVLREIQQCEFIISSSMHGLIVADSFGIPNNRVKFSDGIIDNYKFVDYYSSFNIDEPTPLIIDENFCLGKTLDLIHQKYHRPNLSRLIDNLVNSFPDI